MCAWAWLVVPWVCCYHGAWYRPAGAAGPIRREETSVQLSVTCYTLQTGRPAPKALPSDSPAWSPAWQGAITLHLRLG